MHFIYPNVYSLLPEIKKMGHLRQRTNDSVIDTSETKPDEEQ